MFQAIKYDLGASTPAPGTHRFDVTVQEANRVDALNGLQDLAAQAQSCADAEGPAGHAPPQVSQVATLTRRKHKEQQFSADGFACLGYVSVPPSFDSDLQLHHHVVEAVVAAAAHKATHVVFT